MAEFNELELKYLALTEDKVSPKEFEDWVYQSKWLENELTKDEYLDLISLDFNTPSVKYEIRKILINKINEGKFQEIKFLSLLDSIIKRDGKEGKSLAKMYDLYCDGYYFLQDLGLGIGLQIEVPTGFGVNYFHELNDTQKEQLVNSVYPTAKELAIELKNWIINGELILTGELDSDTNKWQFIDKRTDEDRKSRLWKVVEKNAEVEIKKNLLLDKFGKFIEKLKP